MTSGDELDRHDTVSATTGPDSTRTAAEDARLHALFRLASIILFVLAGMALLISTPPGVAVSPVNVAKWFAVHQDIPVIAAIIFFFTLINSRRRAVGPAASPPAGRPLADWQVIALLVGFAVLIRGLRTLALFDYDLSRDEQMVAFDIAIYAKGQVFEPIAPYWRHSYEALNTLYTLPVGNREGWVSGYLPVNAGIRAVLGHVLPQAVISPVQVLIAGLALWRITLRLWPDSASTRTVVLLLFAGSSQVALMGATAYAMTTHLACNLVWLWLFLQRRLAADAAAIALGFLATGIHQPLFHPLFVLPFLHLLACEKRWKMLAAYVVGYGAIGLFWLAWPNWVSAHGIMPVPADIDVAGVSFVDRLLRGSTALTAVSFWVMGANLLRFLAWQHLLLLPLALVAIRSSGRTDPVCRGLLLGIVLLVAVMTLILPGQVHGWGYRYLHGFIGSAVLIAGYGWRRLEQDGLAPVRAMRWATALSLLVLLPVHAGMVRTMAAPFASASAWLQQVPADLVIVDDGVAAFAQDLVLNRADLSNRPILLLGSKLKPADLAGLCRGRTVAFANSDQLAPLDRVFGQTPLDGPSPHQRQLRDAAGMAGCQMVPALR